MKSQQNRSQDAGHKSSSSHKTQFTGEWELIPIVNEYEGPSPRCGHTMTTHGSVSSSALNSLRQENPEACVEHGKLLVGFGESSLLANREYLDDLHLLDLESLRWTKILGANILPENKPFIKCSINPVARADHAAVSFGTSSDRCLIFGGKCRDTYLDDLIILKNISGFPSSHNRLKIEGIHLPKGPCGRRGSSLCSWKEGSFLLFGGQRGSLFFNDMWGLDLYKQGWVELATRRNPMPRAFHSAFVDSQQQMLLLGGVGDTAANPADADIFKLDLRAGKFFKLGDKDMVPGISSALSKGHHTSHFLDRNCDLLIFAPQKATTYLLGGNVTSEHCGRCTPIHSINEASKTGTAATEKTQPQILPKPKADVSNAATEGGEAGKSVVSVVSVSEMDPVPSGTCRPATALLESHRSPANLHSVGCNDRILERLFVFGGYLPAQRQCTNLLYSLKFSSTACNIKKHTCAFSKTGEPVERKILPDNHAAAAHDDADGDSQLHIPMHDDVETYDNAENHHANGNQQRPPSNERRPKMKPSQQQKQNEKKKAQQEGNDDDGISPNKCMQNVTPMRVSRTSRLTQLRTNKERNANATNQNGQQNQGQGQNQQGQPRSNSNKQNPSTPPSQDSSLLSDSLKQHGGGGNGNDRDVQMTARKSKRGKAPRVSIVQTPVRAKQCLTTNVHKFSMFESKLANQKLHQGLDPELVADCKNKEKLIGNHKQRCEQRESAGEQSANAKRKRSGRNGKKSGKGQSVHWMLIEKLLLNFDESMLDTNHPFLLSPHLCIDLVHRALPLIEKDETLSRIEGPVKVFGDIHGQLGDLMSLFKSFGYPDRNIGDISYFKYVFLGDFVDRGHKSMEVMCLLLALKIEYPARVFLIRGNHECHAMNEMYGFYHEINDRLFPDIQYLRYLDNNVLNDDYNTKGEAPRVLPEASQSECIELDFELDPASMFELDAAQRAEAQFNLQSELKYRHRLKRYHTRSRRYFRDRADCLSYLIQSFELLFRWLPLAVLVSDKILCLHGGIGQIETLEEIAAISRPCDVMCDLDQDMDEQQHQVVDLLWSDPAEKDSDTGFKPNKRGVSCVFGSDIVRNFCTRNNIDLIIRGHQVVADGFEYFAGGHLITLFSATNYCNVMDNAGAILCIDDKLRVLPKLVEARPIVHEQEYDDFEEEDGNGNGNGNGADYEPPSDAESEDNLQWKKLKQFPASPMRDGQCKPARDMLPSDDEATSAGEDEFGGKISLLFEDCNDDD